MKGDESMDDLHYEAPEIASELNNLFGGENDLRQHVLNGVHHRLSTRSSLGVLTGLLSVGFETMGQLLKDPPAGADRSDEGL